MSVSASSVMQLKMKPSPQKLMLMMLAFLTDSFLILSKSTMCYWKKKDTKQMQRLPLPISPRSFQETSE